MVKGILKRLRVIGTGALTAALLVGSVSVNMPFTVKSVEAEDGIAEDDGDLIGDIVDGDEDTEDGIVLYFLSSARYVSASD